MMTSALLLLILVPTLGAIACALMPRRGSGASKLALGVSLLTLLLGVCVAAQFDWKTGKELVWSSAAFQLLSVKFGLKLGADSISVWLVLLTVVLQPLAILASFVAIKERAKEYYAWMLALLAAMIGVFIARDLLLFYVFFELTLIPMFFIIGIWGGPQRRYAAGKFFLFTFSGSVFTLAGIIYIGLNAPNGFDLSSAVTFVQTELSRDARWWLFLAFLAGFAVKVPLFPVHTWLPLAHTEAPTAGSVILAGVLLKLGTYGLLKLAVPMASPDVVTQVAPFIGFLCVVGVIYGSLVAWVQQDIKKLVAYSSVAHLGFCVLGLFALNVIGVQGSVLYMLNHGISTGALFLCIGMMYERYHTRDINELSGLAKEMPVWAFFMVLFTLSSIGLPGTNGYVSEFLTILGAFTSTHLGIAYGSLAALGIILGAIYMLHMVARVVFGPLKTPVDDEHGHRELPTDLSGREIACLVPLALAVVILGVKPNIVLNTIQQPVEAITNAIPSASTSVVATK